MRTHSIDLVNQEDVPRAYRVGIWNPGLVSSCICTVYWNGKAKVMWVDNVETREEFRHQGHATLLMEKVLELAQWLGVDSIELLSNDEETAKRLYGRAGMRPTNKIHRRRILNLWPTKT